jgi:hypothetical protein
VTSFYDYLRDSGGRGVMHLLLSQVVPPVLAEVEVQILEAARQVVAGFRCCSRELLLPTGFCKAVSRLDFLGILSRHVCDSDDSGVAGDVSAAIVRELRSEAERRVGFGIRDGVVEAPDFARPLAPPNSKLPSMILCR